MTQHLSRRRTRFVDLFESKCSQIKFSENVYLVNSRNFENIFRITFHLYNISSLITNFQHFLLIVAVNT